MDLYSTLLTVALTAVGGSSMAVAVILAARSLEKHGRARLRRLATSTAIVGLALAAVALTVHRWGDHRSGSPQEMRGVDFALEHPAPFAIVALAALILRLARRVGR